jgi:hypothetical protein
MEDIIMNFTKFFLQQKLFLFSFLLFGLSGSNFMAMDFEELLKCPEDGSIYEFEQQLRKLDDLLPEQSINISFEKHPSLDPNYQKKLNQIFKQKFFLSLKTQLCKLYESNKKSDISMTTSLSINVSCDYIDTNIFYEVIFPAIKIAIEIIKDNGIALEEFSFSFQDDDEVLNAIMGDLTKIILSLDELKIRTLVLDLSRNMEVQNFKINENKILQLFECINKIESLKNLNLNFKRWKSCTAELLEKMSFNSCLEILKLNLSNNSISSESVNTLVKKLSKCIYLKELYLNLDSNSYMKNPTKQFTNHGLKLLIKTLKDCNKKLEKLTLCIRSNMNVEENTIVSFVQKLSSLKNLLYVELDLGELPLKNPYKLQKAVIDLDPLIEFTLRHDSRFLENNDQFCDKSLENYIAIVRLFVKLKFEQCVNQMIALFKNKIGKNLFRKEIIQEIMAICFVNKQEEFYGLTIKEMMDFIKQYTAESVKCLA